MVAHGEAFEIACGLKEDSFWRPQKAKARLNAAETVAKLDKDGRVVFRIAGQTQNGQLALRQDCASYQLVKSLYSISHGGIGGTGPPAHARWSSAS